MKTRSAIALGACALALQLPSQAHAQADAQLRQATQQACQHLAELGKTGVDVGVLMQMAGCRPQEGAPAMPAPSATAPAQGRPEPSRDICQNIAKALVGTERNYLGFWLGPLPVLMAREYANRCPDRDASSVAQQKLVDGLRRFSSGRFDDSVASLREGLVQAEDDGMRVRLLAETSKSLLAAGRSSETRAEVERALALLEKPAVLAQAPPQPPAPPAGLMFGGNRNLTDRMAQAMRERELAQVEEVRREARSELLVLLGLAELQAGNLPAAIERLRAADALVMQGDENVASIERGVIAPYLALALQRAGQLDEARTLLVASLGGREEVLGEMSAAPRAMEAMGSMALGIGIGIPKVRQRDIDAGAVSSGEMFLPSFACPLLEQIQAQGNTPEQALEAAERCRGRALAQLLANRAFHKPLPSMQELRLNAERRAREPAREQTAGEMRREFMDNPAAEAAGQPARIADMKRMAAERRATVLVYSIATSVNRFPSRMPDRETGLRIWVISPQGQIHLREVGFAGLIDQVDDTYPLSATVLRAREVFGVAGRGPVAVVAARPPKVTRAGNELRRLYRLLIEPVADLLPAQPGARLLIVPQGALFLVPFAALEDASGAPLLSRHAIFTAPSMQTLALTALRQSMPQADGPPLIVGNPVMPRYVPVPGGPALDVPDLPGAEEEARAIGELLKAAPLTGAAATKPVVLGAAREARYIHLATHGFLDDFTERVQRDASPYVRSMTLLGGSEDPNVRTPGLLALAPSASDSGMLSADEIAESSTRAELVVMSACDTGRGAINDEGVIGLSRAWMAAGAPSVLVSLWAIPDEPTRDLMVHFYGRLQAGSGKAEALREAMLATRARYPKPAFWAAFVLMGEPQ